MCNCFLLIWIYCKIVSFSILLSLIFSIFIFIMLPSSVYLPLSLLLSPLSFYRSLSLSQLGFVKINLSEFAGAGKKPGKYLLQSYNDTKHKPDNSLLRVHIHMYTYTMYIYMYTNTHLKYFKSAHTVHVIFNEYFVCTYTCNWCLWKVHVHAVIIKCIN